MSTREMTMPRKFAKTMNRMFQRCSAEAYKAYLNDTKQNLSQEEINRSAFSSMALVSILVLISTAALAFKQVDTLMHF